MNIKIELIKLNKKQNDLVIALNDRGFKATPAFVSTVISGALDTPKAQDARAAISEIIQEWGGNIG